MALETPWAVGDANALHTAATSRVLAYSAVSGGEGVASPGDCKVRQLATAGPSVRIGPGGWSMLNRAAGGGSQAFVGRVAEDEVVPIAATAAGVTRRDLVCLVTRDPSVSGMGGVAGGPYQQVLVVPNVAATVTRLQEVAGHEFTTGIALAMVTVPPSTSAITTAMVKDLRRLAAPRQQREISSVAQGGGTAAGTRYNPLTSNPGFVQWPPSATKDVEVPLWATHALIVVTISQYSVKSGSVNGQIKVTMSGLETPISSYDENYTGTPHRGALTVAGEIAIPLASRGTPDLLRVMGKRTSWTTDGVLDADGFTQTIIDVQFVERIT